MATDSISSNQLNPALYGGTVAKKGAGNSELGKDAFLKLLVTQLKNQDPENPMDGQQMIAQLAQLTQVEKLTDISDKLSDSSSNSLAGYLGTQIVTDASSLEVAGGSAGSIRFEMSSNATNVKAQIIDASGEVVGEKDLGVVEAGKHTVNLAGLPVNDGTYSVKVTGTRTQGGGEISADVSVLGTVTGFIPGADPKLIVDGKQISVSAVKEVTLPASNMI